MIPEGFKPYRGDGTFNDVVQPLYIKKMPNGETQLGFEVQQNHCNFMGMVHGGCVMSFMDMALSAAVCEAMGKYTSSPTINISFDFMSAAKVGDWVFAAIASVKLTRTMGFVSGMLEGPEGPVVRASGVFKLPRELDAHPGMDPEEYYQWRSSQD
ncbi:MAG: PaaI family thioesterase [Pseudomonadales bacterium]|nr:PaaI family thioesterase [Pseudomonadales bacterium]